MYHGKFARFYFGLAFREYLAPPPPGLQGNKTSDGGQPYMEDNLYLKMTYDLRQPLMVDNFNERPPLIEDIF